MKPLFFLPLFLGLTIIAAAQQNTLQSKTDSVCALVKKYFNEKNVDQLYALTGEDFKKALPENTFKNICDNNLFPLGPIKETIFESANNGVSAYKAVFNTVTLSLLLSLDTNDKIVTFLFKPYVDEKAKKTAKVPTTNPLATPLDKEVDAAIQPYISLKATAGVCIGILENGKTTFYGYGETARGNGQIPDKNTLFEIGSITKTFTAILLAEAVEEGKVKLTDPVNKYLPDSIPQLQYEGIPITLEMLSNHSSGLPRMPSNFTETDMNDPYKNYTVNELFSFLKNYKLTRKPGTQYEYSNLAVGLLGVILEKVYHQNFEKLVEHNICHPLKMDDTKEYLSKSDSSRFAKGYNQDGLYNHPWDFAALQSAGALRSTAADLLIYAKANLGEAPAKLNKAIQLTHQITFTEGQTKVGLAWHFIQPANDEDLFHNGETGGYHSYLAIDPVKKFAVVILSNSALGMEDAGTQIMRWLEMHS